MRNPPHICPLPPPSSPSVAPPPASLPPPTHHPAAPRRRHKAKEQRSQQRASRSSPAPVQLVEEEQAFLGAAGGGGQDDHGCGLLPRDDGDGAAVRGDDAGVRVRQVVAHLHSGPVLRDQPLRGPLRRAPPLLPLHLHQQPLRHEPPLHRRRHPPEARRPRPPHPLVTPLPQRLPRVDHHPLLPLHPPQHPRHGHPAPQGHVRRRNRQPHGAGRRAPVHHLVHAHALHVRVPRRQDPHHRAVPGHCRRHRLHRRRPGRRLARRQEGHDRDGGRGQGGRQDPRHRAPVQRVEVGRLLAPVHGVLRRHAAAQQPHQRRDLLAAVVAEPDAEGLQLQPHRLLLHGRAELQLRRRGRVRGAHGSHAAAVQLRGGRAEQGRQQVRPVPCAQPSNGGAAQGQEGGQRAGQGRGRQGPAHVRLELQRVARVRRVRQRRRVQRRCRRQGCPRRRRLAAQSGRKEGEGGGLRGAGRLQLREQGRGGGGRGGRRREGRGGRAGERGGARGYAADERDDAAHPDHGVAQAHPQSQHLLQPHRPHLVPRLLPVELRDAGDHHEVHRHPVRRRPRHGHVQPRAVHGAAAADHRVREQAGDVRHGRAVPDRPGRHGRDLHRRRPPRHAPPRRHRAGSAAPGHCPLRLRQGVQRAPRHPQHGGHLRHAHRAAHHPGVLHPAGAVKERQSSCVLRLTPVCRIII